MARKGGFGTFVLGAVVGSVLTIGALAGTGYWAYKNLSVEKVEQITKQDFGVGEEFSKVTIEQLVNFGVDLSKNSNTYTIEDVASKLSLSLPSTFEISGKDVDLSLFLNNIYKCKLGDIGSSGISNLKNSLTIGNIKTVFGTAFGIPNMKLFESYKNTSVFNLSGIISTLSVKDVLTVEYDSQGNEIPPEGVMALMADMKIMDLMQENAVRDFVYDLRMCDIYEYNGDETGIVQSLKYLKVSELSNNTKLLDAIGTSTIGELVQLDAINGFGAKIKEWKINDIRTPEALQSKINGVRLGDVVTIGDSGFLAQLKNWYISDITEANVMELTVGNVFGITQTSGVLSKIKTLKIGELSNEQTLTNTINTLTISEVLPSNTLYEEGTILYALKDVQVGNLNSKLDTLKVSDIIPAGEGGYSDVMAYLIDPANDKDPLITELPDKLEQAIDEYVDDKLETMTIGELIDAGLLIDNGYSADVKNQKAVDILQNTLDSLS